MESYLNSLPSNFELNEFKLEKVLGQGGFGITYLALDMNLMQHVAIKEYYPREFANRDSTFTIHAVGNSEDKQTFAWGLKRFLEEARVLAQLNHPNIISIKRFFEAHGTAYLVMEYCDGKPLDEIIRDHGTLDETELNGILFPLLDGLKHVHEKAFLHRDIKPANIFIRRNGSPVLLDFGAAKHEMTSHSKSVTSLATAGYAPFEQYSTKGKQGPWSDIYGLAATVYRAISGVKPQDAPDRMLEDNLVPAAELLKGKFSASLLFALDKAMSVRPDARPQTIDQFRGLITNDSITNSNQPINLDAGVQIATATSELIKQKNFLTQIEVGELQKVIVNLLEDHKAENLVVLDASNRNNLFEKIIIVSVASSIEAKALLDYLLNNLNVNNANMRPIQHSGGEVGEWIILDYEKIVVHIMLHSIRAEAKLEETWGEGANSKYGNQSHATQSLYADKEAKPADIKYGPPNPVKIGHIYFIVLLLIFSIFAWWLSTKSSPGAGTEDTARLAKSVDVSNSEKVVPVEIGKSESSVSPNAAANAQRLALGTTVEVKGAEVQQPKADFSFKEIDRIIEAGQLEKAQMLLKEAIRSQPQNAGLYYRMGLVLSREDRYPEAREHLSKAKKIDPSLRFTSPGKFQELYNEILAMEKMSKLPGRD